MDNTNDVNQDSSPEAVSESVREDVNLSPSPAPTPKPEEKTVPYERFQEVVTQLNDLKKAPKKESSVEALDFIKLGKKLQNYSDEEIDFATEHAKSKRPEEILRALDNEMVQLAINAKREKVEKERLSLKPTGTQADSNDRPMTMVQRLTNSSMADKERILTEAGLYKTPKPKLDRTNIGTQK